MLVSQDIFFFAMVTYYTYVQVITYELGVSKIPNPGVPHVTTGAIDLQGRTRVYPQTSENYNVKRISLLFPVVMRYGPTFCRKCRRLAKLCFPHVLICASTSVDREWTNSGAGGSSSEIMLKVKVDNQVAANAQSG